MTSTDTTEREVVSRDRVVIRFAGDSGDGMQLTGDRFTSETASFGNDLSTLPNFPAEIRAPAGTLPGVSSFQLHFANFDILTPGDRPDVLVAMNPAALKANVDDLPPGGVLIVNTDEFTKRNLTKVGYPVSPLDDGSLERYTVHQVAMATLTRGALEQTGLSKKDAERSKNMFALGLLSWMYHRPTEGTERFLREKFAKRPDLAEANVLAFRAGHAYGETTESFAVTYDVAPAPLPAGTYRQITGNTALAYGIVAAGQASRVAGVPRLVPDHAGQRHPARAEQAQGARRHDLPGRGRDRRRRCGAGRGVRRRAGRHHHLRPRDLAEERDDRARRRPRAPAPGDRRAARRPVDGVAHQDRAGRPVAGDVRPQRRGTAADPRAALAR